MAAQMEIEEQASWEGKSKRRSWAMRMCVVVGCLALLGGCSRFRVERQGKDVGEDICDLKNANSAQDAQDIVKDLQEDVNDARRITGNKIDQDVRSVSEQISDLQKHVPDGNSALAQQDISVIQRNLAQAIDSSSGHVQRFYQGVSEGLANCESS
jgi:hypothetical protein